MNVFKHNPLKRATFGDTKSQVNVIIYTIILRNYRNS